MSGRLDIKKRMAKNQRTRFLEEFAKGGNVTAACFASKVARSTIYYLLDHNEAFAGSFEVAENAATDLLLQEARRRALDGIPEPTGWYKGVAGGIVRRYSDNLLMFLLKERRPEYRDKWEVTGAGGQPLQIILSAYGSQEVANKGYKHGTLDPKAPKDPDPDPGPGAPPIEVEAKGVEPDQST